MIEDWDDEAYALLPKVAQIEMIEAQTAYLDEACAGDQLLRQRLERLLSIYRQTGSFLGHPVVPGPDRRTVDPRSALAEQFSEMPL
jgi:hypothetical protein